MCTDEEGKRKSGQAKRRKWRKKPVELWALKGLSSDQECVLDVIHAKHPHEALVIRTILEESHGAMTVDELVETSGLGRDAIVAVIVRLTGLDLIRRYDRTTHQLPPVYRLMRMVTLKELCVADPDVRRWIAARKRAGQTKEAKLTRLLQAQVRKKG